MDIALVTIVVDDYDRAIRFFVDALGFDLDEDSATVTDDGRAKRWVVVRPPGAVTGVLLARADPHQARVVGDQVAGRVGFFLRVDDVHAAYQRMAAAGVRFVTAPRTETYGQVAVFLDVVGRWDLLGAGLSSAGLRPRRGVAGGACAAWGRRAPGPTRHCTAGVRRDAEPDGAPAARLLVGTAGRQHS